MLAQERDFNMDAIEHAYSSARFAADALRNGAPPEETRDVYQPMFAAGKAALAALADLPLSPDRPGTETPPPSGQSNRQT